MFKEFQLIFLLQFLKNLDAFIFVLHCILITPSLMYQLDQISPNYQLKSPLFNHPVITKLFCNYIIILLLLLLFLLFLIREF